VAGDDSLLDLGGAKIYAIAYGPVVPTLAYPGRPPPAPGQRRSLLVNRMVRPKSKSVRRVQVGSVSVWDELSSVMAVTVSSCGSRRVRSLRRVRRRAS